MHPSKPSASLKIYSRESLLNQIASWRSQGDTIVFTNGCFDILHAGHIQYLEAAARLGNRLIVGVNDDASVQRLKGDTRPINALHSRLYLLASLSCTDAVISFTEDTPLHLILAVAPDVLVKGGDYDPETIVGASEVKAKGGKIEVIPFIEGFSTSKLESRILDLHRTKHKES
jgi:D-beta-D-heptose 7-phosphate kinase/D-beta-D-heptose 1-phosphate adenosyltransferase